MTDSFQCWLLHQIRDVLGRHNSHPPFIVWCDPDRAWLDLLHEAQKRTALNCGHQLLFKRKFTNC